MTDPFFDGLADAWRAGDVDVPLPETLVEGSQADPATASVDPLTEDYGRYRIDRVLDRGGMGVVLAADDPDTGRQVALKVLLADHRSRPFEVAKFVQEGRVTAQLEHPAIVRLYEVGRTAGGRPFHALQLVRGESLARRLDSLRRDPSAALGQRALLLRAFHRICQAIAYAHSRSVLHRDLKPGNVMIGAFGEVLVMDWGLARIDRTAPEPAELAPDLPTVPDDPMVTRPGTVMGTPSYMPPEQAAGRIDRIDERSDVFALGAILYEILCLRPPFVGSTTEEVLARVRAGRLERPRSIAGGPPVPRELEAIVLRAMAHAPADRYPSVEALGGEVEAYLEGRLVAAARYNPVQRAVKWALRHRAVSAAALAALVATAALAGHGAWRDDRRRRARVEGAIDEADRADRLAGATGDRRAEVGHRLDQVAALDRALDGAPDDARLRRRRLDGGRALGDAALAAGDHVLARRAYLDLVRFGASAAEAGDLAAAVERDLTAARRQRAERLGALLDILRAGPTALLDVLIDEAAGFRDRQTVEILGQALDAIDVGDGLDPGERRVATFACRVLGRLGPFDPVAVLARTLERAGPGELAIEAGIALCRTRRPEAVGPILAAWRRSGEESYFWRRITPHLPLLSIEGVAPGAVDDPGELRRLGDLRRVRGDLRGSLEFYDRAIAIGPDEPDAHHARGQVLLVLGDVEGALVSLDRALELLPDHVPTLINRAVARDRLDDHEGARADLDRAIELDPDRGPTWVNRAAFRRRRGDLEGALADADRAVALGGPRAAGARLTRAVIRHDLGDDAGARTDVDAAIALEPDAPDAWAERARLLAEGSRWAEAIAAYDRALELDPRESRWYLGRGMCHLGAGLLEAAISDLDEALRRRPDLVDAYLHRGQARRRSGDLEGARVDLDRAVERIADPIEALIGRAHLLLQVGDTGGARADYDRILELDPRHPRALFGRSRLRFADQDVEGTLADLDRALAADPAYLEARTNRGIARLSIGDRPGAIADLERVLSEAPAGWPHRPTVLAYLEQARDD